MSNNLSPILYYLASSRKLTMSQAEAYLLSFKLVTNQPRKINQISC